MIRLLRSLRGHRKLVRDFVVRDLRARYVGSSMGFFWSVVFPIVNLFVYMFVFRLLFEQRWGDSGVKQTAFIMLTGILVWVAFAETLARATNCMVENANLIQKVVFPVEVLPVFLTISSLVNMMIGLPIAVIGCFVFGDAHAGLSIVSLPILLVLQAVFTVGLGLGLSTLNLYWRDTYHLIGIATNVWMFLTPIFYPALKVQTATIPLTDDPNGPMLGLSWLLELNPMHWLIDSWRRILVFGQWPNWFRVAEFGAVSVAVLALGSWFFMSQKKRIPDLL